MNTKQKLCTAEGMAYQKSCGCVFRKKLPQRLKMLGKFQKHNDDEMSALLGKVMQKRPLTALLLLKPFNSLY